MIGTYLLHSLLSSGKCGNLCCLSITDAQVLKPSQRNPITAPKASHITPITAPDPVPTPCLAPLLSLQAPPAVKTARTFPVKKIKTTHITSAPASVVCKKQLPCLTTLHQRSSSGPPADKKIPKRFQGCPIKAPDSRQATTNTTKGSKRILPRVTSVAQDFVFGSSTKSPMVTSDSDDSSDDYSRYIYYDAQIRDSEQPSKRKCRSLDSSPLVYSRSSGSSPGHQLSPPRGSSPVDLSAVRMMDCSESDPSTIRGVGCDGATRMKSKIVKLNQPKGMCITFSSNNPRQACFTEHDN